MINTLCTQREIAAILGITQPRISQLIQEGVLFTDAKTGKLPLGKAVQAYAEYKDGLNADEDSIARYNEERAAHEAVKRQMSELELEKRRGGLVEVDAVEAVWVNLVVACRGELLGLPGRLGAKLAGEDRPAVCTAMIDEAVREALTGLAKMTIDLPEGTERDITGHNGTERDITGLNGT